MWHWRRFLVKLANVVRPHRAERELNRELDSHLGCLEDEYQRRGMAADEARRAARRAVGGLEQTKELHREERSFLWLEHARQDVRHAFRSFKRSPGFTVIGVVTLALGIGANTAIFSVLSAVLLRPLPYPDSNRLVLVWSTFAQGGRGPSALPDYRVWRTENHVFEETGAYHNFFYNLTGLDRPERLLATRMTASMWTVLKSRPLAGALFSESAEQWGQNRIVVLSEGLWRRRFGGDLGVLGRTLQLNGQPYTVTGIMPGSFLFPSPRTELWTPISYAPGDVMDTRNNHFVNVLARLKPGMSLVQAQTELTTITDGLKGEFAENGNIGVSSDGLQQTVVSDVRPVLLLLMAAVAVVLLIACTNAANLSLARATARQKDVTVRVALGAGHGRLVRQLLTESISLAFMGGLVGLALAYLLIQALPTLAPAGIPRLREVSLDKWVLSFTVGLSVLSGLGFGLFPAWHAARTNIADGLKETARTASVSRATQRIRNVLVVSEVALSLVLLVGAGLLIVSLVHLQRVDPGFQPDHLVTARIDLSPIRYREPQPINTFVNQVAEQVQALPGVVGVGLTTSAPFSASGWGKFLTIEGRPDPLTLGEVPQINYSQITPGYFGALRARLRQGRFFSLQDGPDQPAVAIIDEKAARRFWPGEDPVGQRISLFPPASLLRDLPPDWPGYLRLTVVGVVADLRQNLLEEQDALPQVFVNIAQARNDVSGQGAATSYSLVVRTATESLAVQKPIEDIVYQIDKSQPIANWRTMDSLLSDSMARRRFAMQLLSAFAGVALVLAVVGVYGLMAYTVTRRNREIGIRTALGASARNLVWMVLTQGLRLAVTGIVVGLALSTVLSRFISTQLFQVRPIDPLLYTLTGLLLLIVTALASGIPAVRATRVDPVITLRQE